MNKREKQQYIVKFEKALKNFVQELKSYVSTKSGDWTVKGFIDIYKNIYTISSDTKIISKILEIHIFPKILKFAEDNNYKLVLAEHQNWYPDLTFIDNDDDNIKFALDIKTTYRKNNKVAGFTLGSHGSYFKERTKTKNIQFSYNSYLAHFCLGIIYTRIKQKDALSETKIFQVDFNNIQDQKSNDKKINKIKNLKSITSVIKDFDFFVAEKWKIASDKQGSGNTANIGSIKDIEALKKGKGVFSKLGEKWFDEYWMNYGKLTMIKNGKPIKIKNIWDFLEFKGRTDLFDKVVAKDKRKS